MRGYKIFLDTTALLAGLVLARAAKAQVEIDVGVPPVCPYGYYETPPYACAPVDFYGPGFFFNGIFLGVGPWAGWGYGHGWGDHRFVDGGVGRYHGRGGFEANHGHWANGGGHEGHPGGHEGHPGGGGGNKGGGGHPTIKPIGGGNKGGSGHPTIKPVGGGNKGGGGTKGGKTRMVTRPGGTGGNTSGHTPVHPTNPTHNGAPGTSGGGAHAGGGHR